MFALLKRIFVILTVVVAILWGIDRLADAGFRRCRAWEYGTWNDIYSGRVDADMVILGASRAAAQISPMILDSALGTSSYNLGLSAWPFKMQYARLQVYLAHNRRPRYIVEILDDFTMENREDLINYTQFYPYLDDPLIQEAVKGYKGSPDFLEIHIPFLRYIRSPIHALTGCAEYFRARGGLKDAERTRGYSPQDVSWDSSFEEAVAGAPLHSIALKIDPGTVRRFTAFLDSCASQGIRVILVNTPEFHEAIPYFRNRDTLFALYRSLASTHGVPFLDFTGDTIGLSRRYYFDSQHFNRTGAELFSRTLADSLRRLLYRRDTNKPPLTPQ